MYEIKSYSFQTQIPDEFKVYALLHELWESTWETPRFKRYWTEQMTFQNGVSIHVAVIGDTPVGILVHAQERLVEPMYSAALGGNGCKWIKPKPTGDRWLCLGNVGVYVRPEFRHKGIATALFKRFELGLDVGEITGYDFKVVPYMEGSGAAYKLMDLCSTRFYAVDTGSKKDCLFKLVKDLLWLDKLDDREKRVEGGPFYGTRWRDVEGAVEPGRCLSSITTEQGLEQHGY